MGGLAGAVRHPFRARILPERSSSFRGSREYDSAIKTIPGASLAGRCVAVGLLVKRVNPEYPKDVKKKRIQGLVTLRILISRQGDVSQVTLVSGHPALAPLAIDAVKQWRYKPYLLQEEPVEVETTVQINFTLSGS